MGTAKKWGIGIAVVLVLSVLARFLPEDTKKKAAEQQAAMEQQQQIADLTALAQLPEKERGNGFTRDVEVTKGRISIMDTAPANLQVDLQLSQVYAKKAITDVINSLVKAGINPKSNDIDISVRLVSKDKSVTGNDQITSFGRYRYTPFNDNIEWVNGAN